MALIPIPQEVVQNTVKQTKDKIIRQLRAKLKKKETSRAKKFLKKACLKLSQYIISNENLSYNEVDDLIDDMHRSIIYLQKRKQALKKKR